VTRLENILLNPITRRRVELVYGSIDKFFEDPSAQLATDKGEKLAWMRTVTKEEARQCRQKLLRWATSGEAPKNGALGEWVFASLQHGDSTENKGDVLIPSLTPTALQRNWKTPSEFPNSPEVIEHGALKDYAEVLSFGTVFSKNVFGESVVVAAEINPDGSVLSVINNMLGNSVKEWAVTRITQDECHLIHESIGSFFTLQGAMKRHCAIVEVSLNESIDDYA
jgi:hypothetical protein